MSSFCVLLLKKTSVFTRKSTVFHCWFVGCIWKQGAISAMQSQGAQGLLSCKGPAFLFSFPAAFVCHSFLANVFFPKRSLFLPLPPLSQLKKTTALLGISFCTSLLRVLFFSSGGKEHSFKECIHHLSTVLFLLVPSSSIQEKCHELICKILFYSFPPHFTVLSIKRDVYLLLTLSSKRSFKIIFSPLFYATLRNCLLNIFVNIYFGQLMRNFQVDYFYINQSHQMMTDTLLLLLFCSLNSNNRHVDSHR